MTNTAQDAQVFVTQTGLGCEVHITTDGVTGRHALTIMQPALNLGTKFYLSDRDMEAVAIGAAQALSRLKRS